MKKNFLIGSFYLAGTISVLMATDQNMSVGTVYWTKLTLLYLMGFYAVLNIMTFVFKKGEIYNTQSSISNGAKYSQYFELIMGIVFIAAFVYNLFAK